MRAGGIGIGKTATGLFAYRNAYCGAAQYAAGIN
jgi:hypothetical protein